MWAYYISILEILDLFIEWLKGALARAMLQAVEEGTTILRHFLVHHVDKKAFLPVAAGHKRCLCGTWASGRNVAKMAQEEPWQVGMLHGGEGSRKALQSSANLPQGKVPSWPQDWGSAIPLACRQDCLLIPQPSGHASQEMPKPYSLSTWSRLRAFQGRPNAIVLISPGGKNPFQA